MKQNIFLTLFSLFFIVNLSYTKEYNSYILRIFQDDNTIASITLTKNNENLWIYEKIECPAEEENISAENLSCTCEKRDATETEINEMLSMTRYFPLLHVEFKTECPALLKFMGEDILTFLRNKYLFHNSQGEIYILTFNETEEICNFTLKKATPEERKMYIKIQAFKQAFLTKQLSENHEMSITKPNVEANI